MTRQIETPPLRNNGQVIVPEHSSFYTHIIVGKDNKIYIIDVDGWEAPEEFIQITDGPEDVAYEKIYRKLILGLRQVCTKEEIRTRQETPQSQKAMQDLLIAYELIQEAGIVAENLDPNIGTFTFKDLREKLGAERMEKWPFPKDILAGLDYMHGGLEYQYQLMAVFHIEKPLIHFISRIDEDMLEEEEIFLDQIILDIIKAAKDVENDPNSWMCVYISDLKALFEDRIVRYYISCP